MAQIRFANNVSTQLTKPVAADDSTIEVRSLTQGLVWPNISATGDYFLIVIDDISSSTWEIMKCTKVQVNGNETVLTVERGLEGTTATTFQAGSVVENRLTAGTLDTFGEGFPAKVEINRGGTGATTAAQARTNLDVPSKADLSSEVNTRISEVARLDQKITDNIPPAATTSVRGTTILSNAIDSASEAMAATPKAVKTAYDDLNNKILSVPDVDAKTIIEKDGKVIAKDIAIDGDITDLASARGLFNAKGYSSGVDYNTLTKQGIYAVSAAGSTNGPGFAAKVVVYNAAGSKFIQQIAYNIVPSDIKMRTSNNEGVWTPWVKYISEEDVATTSTPGIVQLNSAVNSASETLAATSKAVKTAYDKAAAAAAKSALANKLTTARSITLTGPVTGTVNFDGSANVSIPTTVVSATTSAKGIVQLSNATNSTRETLAATAKAVKAAYDKAVAAANAAANAGVVGEYKAAHLESIPGYLLCNGASVSRTTYAKLFAVLDTKFGAGDGSKTFNLPDFRNHTFWGADANLGIKIAAGLPNITGEFNAYTWDNGKPDGAFSSGDAGGSVNPNGSGRFVRFDLNAVRSSAIYGKSSTVQPPAVSVNIFIKY